MDSKTKLFDLATIYEAFSIHEVMEKLYDLKEAKEELDEVLFLLKLDTENHDSLIYEIMRVTEEVEIAEKNIKTLELAIMCFETKIFEKVKILDKVAVICMN